MIIVSAGAGLGNQMFEYAFYLKLKKQYPAISIYLDPDYAFVPAHNGYEVEEIFGLNSNRPTKEEILLVGDKSYLANIDGYTSIFNKLRRKLKIRKKTFLIQKDFTEYYPEFLELDSEKSWYLYGPFANYKYFSDIKEEVLKAFSFPEIDEKNRWIAEQIKNNQSISVHVRRGDYVDQGVDTLKSSFYDNAIELIKQKTLLKDDDITIYIFSDDRDYVQKIFKDRKNVVFVEGNTGKCSYRDMQLMSMCRHNIIADSTFSFWAAYLNSNPQKIVVGPERPFKGFKNPFTCDDWIRLKE